MLKKIKNYPKDELLATLRDPRAVGLFIFLVVVLMISWSGVKVIESNYQLQKQISVLQQENDLQTLKNNNLKLQNQYYNSNQYLDITARQNFGLAAPGEKELIVPKAVALAHAPKTSAPDTTSSATAASVSQSFLARNLSAWRDFLLNRNQ